MSPSGRIVVAMEQWKQEAIDPHGRRVVFDRRTRGHLERRRPDLLDQVETVLRTISLPDHHEDDPFAGRERFYRRHILSPGRWLRVVVDFNESPGWIVTVLVQDIDPRKS
ncbi:MAG TPA: hypothetical protein VG147_03630 [Solirubrobacteraceae bacterium]|nr:hypothetical protein [Solirubrobacteraceae bacterium]